MFNSIKLYLYSTENCHKYTLQFSKPRRQRKKEQTERTPGLNPQIAST
uniref:Uncharacterized protein n=1 Tax=Anguilla anguilla TaxID=7936 RepID=A0A0E9R9V3_ANGAN